MTEWRKHTGTEMPSELAAAQIVEFRMSWTDAVITDRADSMPYWGWIGEYRPALTEDGLPYVSAEGLDNSQDPKYVITETDGLVTALEEDWEPVWWGSDEGWDVGPQPRRPAPSAHAIPGDPANSLAKVWRG